MNTAIEASQLSKNYRQVQALKNLSFKIKKGECAGLLGPNGAGKSTTVQILLGCLKPSSGSASLFGINPTQRPKDVHAITGYLPDHPSLYEDLTVYQNIDLFRQIYRQDAAQTKKAIKKLDLEEKSHTKAKHLSKGLLQRLLIARSIVHTPQILIMDEPTVALDPSSTDFIRQILAELKSKGVTLLLCTHLMSLAEKLCDHIILLNKGEKAEDGSLNALKKKYGSAQLEVKFQEGGEIKTLFLPLNENGAKELEAIRKTKSILSVNDSLASLDEIFIRLVRDKKP